MSTHHLPTRLAAPPATWTRDVDVVVLGSGAAGLSAALAARPVRTALIVTKDTLDAGSTAWAQGGLAGVLDPSDSFEAHVQDTLATGAGLGLNFTFRDWLRLRSELVMTGFFNAYSEGNDSLRMLNWSPDWVNDLTMTFFKQRAICSVWHKMTGRTPFFFEEGGQVIRGVSEPWDLLNASIGANFFQRGLRLNAGVKNILNVRQIRSGAADIVGHSEGDYQPVHWGRTYFVTAIFAMHSKS